jgi:hypothetical protein
MNAHSFCKAYTQDSFKASTFARVVTFGGVKNVGLSEDSQSPTFKVKKSIWRRGQDSNLQALSRGSFQDYCLTN